MSDLICELMKNNAIINNKRQIDENCLMLPSEMSIQEVAKDCASFGVLMEAIYFIFALIIVRTEYPDVFDKNAIFSAFCLKITCKKTHSENFRKHMQIEKAPANQENIFINLTASAANAHNTTK